MPRPDHDLLAVLRPLTAVLVDRTTVPAVLALVADRASGVLGAAPEVSLTVLRDGAGRTVAASGDLAARLDEVQYRAGDGPCLAAARAGEPVHARADDLAGWADFAPALRAAGVEGVWSHPLPPSAQVPASLNLYLRDGGRPDGAAAVAELAAGPVSRVWRYHEVVRSTEDLRAAMESRAVIEQAKGVLMERRGITADQAFEVLVRTSNDTNTKLRDVALRIVDTGELPR